MSTNDRPMSTSGTKLISTSGDLQRGPHMPGLQAFHGPRSRAGINFVNICKRDKCSIGSLHCYASSFPELVMAVSFVETKVICQEEIL